jgi:hypothetical protein
VSQSYSLPPERERVVIDEVQVPTGSQNLRLHPNQPIHVCILANTIFRSAFNTWDASWLFDSLFVLFPLLVFWNGVVGVHLLSSEAQRRMFVCLFRSLLTSFLIAALDTRSWHRRRIYQEWCDMRGAIPWWACMECLCLYVVSEHGHLTYQIWRLLLACMSSVNAHCFA